MRAFITALLTTLLSLTTVAQTTTLRAPAVPLVPVDPYFSIWSPADQLTGADTTHWTEAPQRLTSLIRIDGKAYRVMGKEPADVPALEQKSLTILPTTVTYAFEGAGVRLELAFLTPLLPDDLMVFSRPVTYLTWQVRSTDGAEHAVQIHYDNTAELVVHDPRTQKVYLVRRKDRRPRRPQGRFRRPARPRPQG